MPTRKLDETELSRKDAIDLARTIVRYKHRAAMRRELNDIEQRINADFDHAILRGKELTLNAGRLMDSLSQ
jgi:hypothetical protein